MFYIYNLLLRHIAAVWAALCTAGACSKCLLKIDCGSNRFLIDSNRETKCLIR